MTESVSSESVSYSTATIQALIMLGDRDFAFFLTPDSDYYLYLICYQGYYRRSVSSESEMNDPEILREVERFRSRLRGMIQSAIDSETRRFLQDQKRKVLESVRELNQVSKFGTTAEMAEKLGVSKKQIRKLRRDGELELYFGE